MWTVIVKGILKKHNLKVAYTTCNNNSKNFTKLKSRDSMTSTWNVIYSIPCSDCDKNYVRTTSQVFKYRLTKHIRDTRLKSYNTTLAIHAFENRHKFNSDKAKILDIEKLNKRLISERLHILKTFIFIKLISIT